MSKRTVSTRLARALRDAEDIPYTMALNLVRADLAKAGGLAGDTEEEVLEHLREELQAARRRSDR